MEVQNAGMMSVSPGRAQQAAALQPILYASFVEPDTTGYAPDLQVTTFTLFAQDVNNRL